MNAMTTKERVEAMRKRRVKDGIKRLEIKAHIEDHPAIKEFADKLAQQRERRAKRVPKAQG